MKTRLQEMFEAFETYHRVNPDIWPAVKLLAIQAADTGRKRYSINAVIERVRWHMDIDTQTTDGFKINNNHHAFFARMFCLRFPKLADFFSQRELKSGNEPAKHPEDGPPAELFFDAEMWLTSKMKQLLRETE